MVKSSSTIVRWNIPNDLYARLKAEAAKEINMPVATYALNVLNRNVAKGTASSTVVPSFVSAPHKATPHKIAPDMTTEEAQREAAVARAIAEWDAGEEDE